ncbi:MAG: ribosome maturation factor RimP [Endomicrobia bacterium]|jgi:ribosome maturation factor RimP|nr:ribosome maturation factor RimP [Endomicrobiia bacterium]
MMSKTKALEELLTPAAEAENIEIIDVQYLKENGNWVARVFIDKKNGITMGDCERMSYVFGDMLDASDILNESYVLEVSSPGINRALKKEKDFKNFVGSKARIQTFNAINNQRNFLGEILSAKDGKIKINDVTKGEVEIELADIKKANLEADI